MTKHFYSVDITDRDNETHSYHFLSSSLWIVTSHISVTMSLHDGFYGHKQENTVVLVVNELTGYLAVPVIELV